MNSLPVCLSCRECGIQDELTRIWASAIDPGADSPDIYEFVKMQINATKELILHGQVKTPEELGVTLAALFDLVVSLQYAALVTDTGWIYCPALSSENKPLCIRPYVKACPRCAVLGRKVVVDAAERNKPPSATIGQIASRTLILLLYTLSQVADTGWQIRLIRSSGDIDVVLYNNTTIALGEVKASPLLALPLLFSLSAPIYDNDEIGGRVPIDEHRVVTIPLADLQNGVSLYVPTTGQTFMLGLPNEAGFPYQGFINRYTDKLELLYSFIVEWQKLYEGYKSGWSLDGDTGIRWLTCGCGGKVDDSKNAPGLDRTDDIKKGIYQMLKLGERFSARCRQRRIKVVLIGNTFPIRHYDDYLAGLEDITWARESQFIPSTSPEQRIVRYADLIKLWDAVITFTGAHFRDGELHEAFGLQTLFKRLGGNIE